VRWLPAPEEENVANDSGDTKVVVVTEAMVRAVDADVEKGIVKMWTWSKIRKHCLKDLLHLLPVEEPLIARFGAVFVFRPQAAAASSSTAAAAVARSAARSRATRLRGSGFAPPTGRSIWRRRTASASSARSTWRRATCRSAATQSSSSS
jgi:hypothetical protein